MAQPHNRPNPSLTVFFSYVPGWISFTANFARWADWGAQFRKAPGPNLASPAFRAAAEEAMRPFLARISTWHAALVPQGKQSLLAGVKCVWEGWIGTNFFD